MIAGPKHKNKRPVSLESGFTLVEMMVALAVGLFLVGGLVSLLVSTSASRMELDKSSNQLESGRYALQLLSEEVRHAGFLGTYMPSGAAATTPDPCDTTGANFPTVIPLSFPVFIYGYDGATTAPSCVTTRLAGTAILVVRRVSTTSTPAASPVAGEVYFQSLSCVSVPPNPNLFVISTGGFTLQTKDCATLAPLNKYMVRVYYVSSCNVCSPSDNIPTLKVAEYVLGAMTVTPLVENIENLQVDYGIDMDGDGSPDCYVNNPSSTATACATPASYVWTDPIQNWSNVVSVRIHVLARNNDTSGGWTDTRTYDLGLAGTYTPPAGDRYKRHAYSAVARVVNVSGRRETP